MMKKDSQIVGVVTWITYHNFGTYLQAYALQRILKLLGYENYIISDSRFVKKNKNILWGVMAQIYHSLGGNQIIAKGVKKANQCYNDFARNYLMIDNVWSNFKDLEDRYDIFICGSDQIWSPIVPLNSFYFLGFTNKKKVAYAPSIGQRHLPECRIKMIKPFLESFSALSVREYTAKSALLNYINKKIDVVLDPTLLLPSEVWNNLVGRNEKSEQSYILCYLLSYNEVYIKLVKEFSNISKLPIKIIITDKRFLRYSNIPLFIGPMEFLKELKNAAYIFTDSFHGSIFAIHFKKRFWTFKRFNDNEENNQNSRIIDLFSILGIADYFVDEFDFIDKLNLPNINYDMVNEKITVERDYSLNYLKSALER